ncbi:MAG: transglutaminase N-terminal domain-containing protein [Verrucomicrobiales bacterium]
MSLLKIIHETAYQYDRPVRFGPHRLVLRPREGHDLQVERMSLAISPAHTLEWCRDVFGNSVATVDFLAEAPELRIVSELAIRRRELPRMPGRPPVHVSHPVVCDGLEGPLAAAYLAPVYPAEASGLQDWAAQAISSADSGNAVSVVSALNQAIPRQIGYHRRLEGGVQTPLETLARRTGSCRDTATLLMEACRALGIAARFASGYLDCPASLAGRASAHAWAEAYFPGRGWKGFDPTLGGPADARHITIGLSNHPRGVMPVTGSYYGPKTAYLGMTVAVKFEPPPDRPSGMAAG